MQTRNYFLTVLLAVLFSGMAGSASAEIILTIDKAEYEGGEIVHIAAHNAGPIIEYLVSSPYFSIWNLNTDKCVFGCVGLPVVTQFAVGETVSMDWDTGSAPDDPGNYSVSVAVIDGPSVSYTLTVKVGADRRSWSSLKQMYR